MVITCKPKASFCFRITDLLTDCKISLVSVFCLPVNKEMSCTAVACRLHSAISHVGNISINSRRHKVKKVARRHKGGGGGVNRTPPLYF